MSSFLFILKPKFMQESTGVFRIPKFLLRVTILSQYYLAGFQYPYFGILKSFFRFYFICLKPFPQSPVIITIHPNSDNRLPLIRILDAVSNRESNQI